MIVEPVVSLGNAVKLLLPGRVPKHQSHLKYQVNLLNLLNLLKRKLYNSLYLSSLAQGDHPLQEIDPDGFLVLGGEDAPAVPPDEGGLADAAVPHHDHLQCQV